MEGNTSCVNDGKTRELPMVGFLFLRSRSDVINNPQARLFAKTQFHQPYARQPIDRPRGSKRSG